MWPSPISFSIFFEKTLSNLQLIKEISFRLFFMSDEVARPLIKFQKSCFFSSGQLSLFCCCHLIKFNCSILVFFRATEKSGISGTENFTLNSCNILRCLKAANSLFNCFLFMIKSCRVTVCSILGAILIKSVKYLGNGISRP
ncbi:unnamed protein product [Moneuplotes crassus]|uniref:Uncharacterized protein n=1 Tax=Euplotes crassus TaxID=5936 RepID=A0AAD1XUB6_EUPCR|nr:unnamed protein product [Moneuplotes crassus]